MRANFALLLLLLTTSLVVIAQDSHRPLILTIDQARQALRESSSNEMLGTISLQGLDWSREVDLGRGIQVIVLSKNRSGGLVLFSADGRLELSVTTNEITSLQCFDLNNDGVSELVTEEVEGRGTGILVKAFKIYSRSVHGLEKVWERRSYSREAHWDPNSSTQKVRETSYFLRFDSAGAGAPDRMTYLEPSGQSGQYKKSVYTMDGLTVRQVTEADYYK
jgi:hypothetical protein